MEVYIFKRIINFKYFGISIWSENYCNRVKKTCLLSSKTHMCSLYQEFNPLSDEAQTSGFFKMTLRNIELLKQNYKFCEIHKIIIY